MKRFAIVNARIFTVDPNDRVIPHGYLLVEDDRIRALGPMQQLPAIEGLELIDAEGRALLPGLVDAHSHSSLMRGVTENLALMQWLPLYQLEHRALTPDDAWHSARLCYLEALQNGTTCVMDMYRFMDRCAEAAGEIGIRVNLAPYVADRPGKDFFATQQENLDLIASHQGAFDGRVRTWMGLEHLFYCTPQAYRRALDAARDHDLYIHTHACEQAAEEQAVEQQFGLRSIPLLDSYGILGERTLLAHCVWLNDDEIRRLADSGTAVAHCPVSNAKLASGVARLPEMLAAGITVGLGTDGNVCNNSLDLFEEMKFASLLQKATRLDPCVLPAAQMLRMATIDGARALKLGQEIGSLEAGKKADFILLDLQQANLTPLTLDDQGGNLLWNLVFSARGSNVRDVWVNGVQVLANRRPTRVDEAQLLQQAQRCGEDLMRRCEALKSQAVAVV